MLAQPARVEAPAERMAAAFVAATSAMSCAAAAELIGVQPVTIRKWRRRTPRSVKAATTARLNAWLTGDRSSTADEGLHRAFSHTLRGASARR
ncbi:hypothetical protein [Longimicrobium sp.]|uniref:hypothetical protein n=1 Tax=Longimicrobium sp. TaxID=2029185 RepID=UPI003B3AFDA8